MAKSGRNGPRAKLPRAPRFPIQMPTRYRVRENSGWHHGRIENISRSGVLFRATYLLALGMPVEMSFMLPMTVLGEPAAQVICQGHIVRTAPPLRARTSPAFLHKEVANTCLCNRLC